MKAHGKAPNPQRRVQAAGFYLSGETLHALAKRHDISRNLIRIWVEKFQAGALDEDWRRPIFSRIMRRALPPSSGWSANRLWSLSF
jgi:transposase-like protein